MNTEEAQREKQTNFNLKTQSWFLGFSYKHNNHNTWDLPKFYYNYLVNPQTLCF